MSLSSATSRASTRFFENEGNLHPSIFDSLASSTIEGRPEWRRQPQQGDVAATSRSTTLYTPTLTSLISSRPIRKYSTAAGEFRHQFRSRPEIRAIVIREDDHTDTIGQMEAIRDPDMKDDKVYNHNFHWAMKHFLQDKNASQELQRTWQSLAFKSNKRRTDDRARQKVRKANAAARREGKEQQRERLEQYQQNGGPEEQNNNDEEEGEQKIQEHFNTASNRACRRARKQLELFAPHMNRPLEENIPSTGFMARTPMEIVRWASVTLIPLYTSEKVLTAALRKFFEDREGSYDALAVKLALGRRSLELKSKLNSFSSSSSRRRLQREASRKDGNADDEEQQMHRSNDPQGDVEGRKEEKEDSESEDNANDSPQAYLHQSNNERSRKAVMTADSLYDAQTGNTPNVSSLLHSIDWWRPPPQVEREW